MEPEYARSGRQCEPDPEVCALLFPSVLCPSHNHSKIRIASRWRDATVAIEPINATRWPALPAPVPAPARSHRQSPHMWCLSRPTPAKRDCKTQNRHRRSLRGAGHRSVEPLVDRRLAAIIAKDLSLPRTRTCPIRSSSCQACDATRQRPNRRLHRNSA